MRGAYRHTRPQAHAAARGDGSLAQRANPRVGGAPATQHVPAACEHTSMDTQDGKVICTMHLPAVQRCVFGLRHADAADSGAFGALGGGGGGRGA